MKHRYFLFLFIGGVFFFSNALKAQMVGTNIFLPGHWLEVGQQNNGDFGATTSPAGYHPDPGPALASVYDYGHDGWAVGSPPYFGDYTFPGSPFEGWEIQINGVRSQAFCNGGAGTYTGGTLTGNNISYTNAGGVLSALWKGTAGIGGVLAITQTTRVDTNGSAIIVTTVLKNTGAATIPGIYYLRSCDPDNDQTNSGLYTTNNTIAYQNDVDHRVMVTTKGTVDTDAFLALGTKDCRAVAFIYQSGLWPLSSTQNLATIWSQTWDAGSGAQYTLHGILNGDNAIGLVYNIGSIAGGDSTVLSYAYVYNGINGLDSAFPDPQLVVNNSAVDSVDTFNTCSYPGVTSLPVSIANASTGVWTLSTWKWSPALGLATTSGVTNTVNINALSAPITYTITGSDSLAGAASGCDRWTFLLTVIPCFNVSNNGPVCQGDTLDLYAHGDSTGATYTWYNAAGTLVASVQNPVILNATLADSGLYMAIKTVSGINDTAYTDVVIKPLPVVTAGSNAPICSGNTLLLTATVDSPDVTFAWTGPDGFTSFVQDPSITGTIVSESGIYQVVTGLNGCIDSTTINVVIDSTPAQPVLNSNSPVCSGTTLQLTATDITPGVSYSWSGPNGFVAGLQNPSIAPATLAATGIYSVTASLGMCTNYNTTTATVDSTPVLPALGSNAPICSGSILTFSATGTSGATFSWNGPNSFVSLLQYPIIVAATTAATGTYSVIASIGYGTLTCSSPMATLYAEVDSTPAVPSITTNGPVCEHTTLLLGASSVTPGVTYFWTGPDGFTSTLQNPSINNAPFTSPDNTYNVIVTVGNCHSDTTFTDIVKQVPLNTSASSNSPVCSGFPHTLSLLSTFDVIGGTYNWFGALGYNSISASSDANISSPTTTASGVYGVSETLAGCTSDTTYITVVVDSTPALPTIGSNSPICQGDTLKLFSSDGTSGVSFSWSGPNGFTGTSPDTIILNTPTVDSGTYVITVTSPSVTCTNSNSVLVHVTPTPAFTPTSNSPICSGDTIFLYANGLPNSTFSWTGPYGFVFNSPNPSTPTNPFIVNAITEYSGVYIVTALLNGCTTTEYDTVVVNQTPDAPWVSWLTYCQFYPAPPLMATGSDITWYKTDSIQGGIYTVTPTPPTAVVGSTFYFASQTVMGCRSAIDSIKVTVNPTPKIDSITPALGLCPHDTAFLTAIDTDAVAYYHWYPSMYLSDTNTSTVVTRPETDMTYSVVATNQYGCSDTASVNVTVFPAAVISLGDSLTLYPGETYTMTPLTNCVSFLWFPPAGLSDAYISNPVASPVVSSKYTVIGTTENNCTTQDSISIYVSAATALAIPNAFTPGGESNNTYKVVKKGIATLVSFRIFDRWGVKVFETTDIDAGWDGNYKGQPQPFGVYVYEVEAIASNGERFVRQGNLTLLR